MYLFRGVSRFQSCLKLRNGNLVSRKGNLLSARDLYLECPLAKRKFREEPLSKNLSEPLAKILSEAMRKILNENFKQKGEGNFLSLNDSLL